MRAMATDYGPDGIRVNAIVPGTIDTPMNATTLRTAENRARFAALAPLGRLGTPDDLAGIAVYLASEDFGLLHRSCFHRGRRADGYGIAPPHTDRPTQLLDRRKARGLCRLPGGTPRRNGSDRRIRCPGRFRRSACRS